MSQAMQRELERYLFLCETFAGKYQRSKESSFSNESLWNEYQKYVEQAKYWASIVEYDLSQEPYMSIEK